MSYRISNRLAVLVALAAVAAAFLPGGAEGQLLRSTPRARISDVAVDRAPVARDRTVRMAVEVEIAVGMHVNANPPTYDWLIPVEVSVAGVDGVRVIEAYYPEAESRKFPYDEKPFLVYEGTFVVGLLLAVAETAATGDRELEIVLDYQACNDQACFAPTETSVRLPVTIVADPGHSVETESPLLARAPFPKR